MVLGMPQKLLAIEPVSMYGSPIPLSRRRQSARSSRSVNVVARLVVQRSANEGEAGTQLTFDLGVVGIRAPRTDPLPCHVARELVERKRDPEALFAGHPSVPGDLLLERGMRIHRVILLPAVGGCAHAGHRTMVRPKGADAAPFRWKNPTLPSAGPENASDLFDLEPAPRLELGTC